MFQNVPLSLYVLYFYIHIFWEKNVYPTEPRTIYGNLAELELQHKNEKLWGKKGTKVKRKKNLAINSNSTLRLKM